MLGEGTLGEGTLGEGTLGEELGTEELVSGSSNASSGSSASLSLTDPITGTSSASSGSSASLSLTDPITGTSSASSGSSASLNIAESLAGVSSGTSGHSADLTLIELTFTGSGGIVVGGSSPITFITNSYLFPFSWNVNGLDEATLRYYQVLGKCQVPPSCETTGFEIEDEKCSVGGSRSIQIFAARNLTDLCNKMKAWFQNLAGDGVSKFWPIDKIFVYDRPTYTSDYVSGQDYSCNQGISVDFTEIAACADFLIDFDLLAEVGVETFYQEDFHQADDPEGGITIGGEAIVVFTQAPSNYFSYTPSGEIIIGGDAPPNYISEYFTYTMSGGIEIGGTGDGYQTAVDPLDAEIGLETDLLLYEPAETVFEPSESTPEIEADSDTVEVGCGCDPASLLLYMSHNLDKSAVLSEFLTRNALTFPSEITLAFNDYDSVWRANYHYRGLGEENDVPETWSIVFEWACITTFAEEDLDENMWKLSVLVVRSKRRSSGVERTETRLLYTFPEDAAICDDQGGIEFEFKVNSITGIISLPTQAPRDYILDDEIGLFDGKYWVKKPNIQILISETILDEETPTKDIKPIFPT